MAFCLVFKADNLVLILIAWCLWIVAIAILPVFSGSVNVIVSRSSNPPDSFKVFTQCTASTCLSMGAALQPGGLHHCDCRCLTSSSTFVAQDLDARSQCVDNVDIRSKYAKCQYFLSPNLPSSPITVLDLSEPPEQPLNVTWSSITPKPVCPVMQGNGQYLMKGKWFNVDNTTIFTLDNNVLKWSGLPLQPGYIVRIQFTCQSQTHCLVFKNAGSITYIIDLPTTIVSSLSPSPTQRPTSRYASSSTTMTLKTTKEILIPVTPTMILPTRTSVSVTSSYVVPICGISSNQIHSCARGTSVFCKWLYVGLTAAGCVCLLLILTAVIVLFRKRRRRRRSNSNKKNEAAFIDCELPTKRCSCNTELMTLVVQDSNNFRKPLTCTEHGSEEELHGNQSNGKRNTYSRPLLFVESEVRQIIPTSVQRLSSLSDDEFSDDKRHLLRQHSSQSSLQTREVMHPNLAPKDAILHLENDEEDTYEVMDSKMVSRENDKPTTTKGKRTNEITGLANRSFQDDDKRLSIYETVEDCKNSHTKIPHKHPKYETMKSDLFDDRPNYEAMESSLADEQPNYEAIESSVSDEQPNYEAMESSVSDEQQIYTTMVTGSFDEQPDYEAMETATVEQPNYEIMNASDTSYKQKHQPSCLSGRKNQTEETKDEVYEIPQIIGNEEDPEYEITPIPTNFKNQNANLDRVTVPKNHYLDKSEEEYTYANRQEFQEREAREKIQGRKSWYSGDQPSKIRVQNLSGTRTIVDPGFPIRKQSQETKSNQFIGDEDELYSVAEHPKPPPEIAHLGRQGAPDTDNKQYSRKNSGLRILNNDNSPARYSTFLTETSKPVYPTNSKARKISTNSSGLVIGNPGLTVQAETKQSTKRHVVGENTTCDNIPVEQPLYINPPVTSVDATGSVSFSEDNSHSVYDEVGSGDDSEVVFPNFPDDNISDNEQPLYENFEICTHP